MCVSRGPDEEFDDIEDRIEQDIVCAYVSVEADVNNPAAAEEIAEAAHDEICAFYSREDARAR